MRRALIGHTGFVGGTLARQGRFDRLFNRSNIADIAGQSFDEIWCAGVPAVKWLANKDPAGDDRAIAALREPLSAARCGELILVSTVDVFDPAVGVDETTPVRTEGLHAYGLHRYRLEEDLKARFRTTVARLPGLFGRGLKKNVIFDFLTGNATANVDHRGVFQFYSLDHLTEDIERARAAGLGLVHIAAEPVSVAEVARIALGREFHNPVAAQPARYDMRSVHAGLWGRTLYQYPKDQVLRELEAFCAAAARGGVLGTPA